MASPGIPSLPLPSDGDHDRGAAVIAVGAVFGSLGLILVSTRLWVRWHIIKKLGLDDLFIFLGLIFILTVIVMQILEVRDGVGRHQYYLNLSPQLLLRESNALALVYISETIFTFSTMFTRISICIFLLRIFGNKRVWRWGLHFIIAFVTVTSLAAGISVLLQCQPIRKVWKPSQPGTCWQPEIAVDIGDFNGASSVLCDCALATLPIAFMWNVQMSLRRKMGICVLMGMGFFGVCAIVRSTLLKNEKTKDVSWNSVDLLIWGGLEGTIGIIAACIPTITPLFNPARRNSHGRMSRLLSPTDGSSSSRCREDKYRLHETVIDPGYLPSLPLSSSSPMPVSRHDGDTVEINGGKNVGIAETIISEGGCQSSSRRRSD